MITPIELAQSLVEEAHQIDNNEPIEIVTNAILKYLETDEYWSAAHDTLDDQMKKYTQEVIKHIVKIGM